MAKSAAVAFLFLLALVACIAATTAVAAADADVELALRSSTELGGVASASRSSLALGRRSLLQVPYAGYEFRNLRSKSAETCTKKPSICKKKGSKGEHCCKGNCVDILTDTQNCGKCGHIVGKGKVCCTGNSVDLKSNKENCGRCGNKCPANQKCKFGICNYAA